MLSKLQVWTTPLWLVLMVVPFVYLLISHPDSVEPFFAYQGEDGDGGAEPRLDAAGRRRLPVADRPDRRADRLPALHAAADRRRTRAAGGRAVILAGPGWVIFGAIKQVVGLFLAVYIIANVADGAAIANQPVHQFLRDLPATSCRRWWRMTLAVVLVVISQIKINVTNAYSGSLAWTNSFTRVTKRYPGRLVFLGFNLLDRAGADGSRTCSSFLNTILGFYANCGMAWVVTVASDIVINKYLLKISPMRPEFRRGMLYAVNPVGFGSMLIAAGRVDRRVLRRPRRGDPAVLAARGDRARPGAAAGHGRRHQGQVLPAPHRRRHRPADVRRGRQPVGRDAQLPRLPPATTSGRTWSRAQPHDALHLLAVPEHRQARGARPARRSASRPGLNEGVAGPFRSGEKPVFREVTEVAYRGGMTGLRPRLPWM